MANKIPETFRFWKRVHKTSGCWMWTGRTGRGGYGIFSASHEKAVLAHRRSFELVKGLIPEGLTLDHLCRNRLCVNPDHLEPVSLSENNRRSTSPSALNSRKNHCKHGHEFTPENTHICTNGGRLCKECSRINRRKYRARHLERLRIEERSRSKVYASTRREQHRRYMRAYYARNKEKWIKYGVKNSK